MTFEQLVEKEIPNWRQTISVEVLSELKDAYEKSKEYEQMLENIMDMSFKYASIGIDYSTDYQKTNERWLFYRNLFSEKLNEAKNIVNKDKTVEVESKKN